MILSPAALPKVEEFYRWWATTLTSLLPVRVRRLLFREPDILVLLTGDAQDTACLYSHGSPNQDNDRPYECKNRLVITRSTLDKELATIDRSETEIMLLLPAASCLTRTISLPAATVDRLRDVLAFEMDKYTPFMADRVYYDYHVLETTPETVTLELSVVEKSLLDDALVKTASWKLQPDIAAIDISAVTGSDGFIRPQINFLEHISRKETGNRWRILGHVLIAVSILLAAANLAAPVLQKAQLVEELEVQLIEVERSASVAIELQSTRDRILAINEGLLGIKNNHTPVVDTLLELTRVLPDTTWVQKLEIREGALDIQGQSESSSELPGIIEASPLFINTSFLSPVTKDIRTNKERFRLSTDIETGGNDG